MEALCKTAHFVERQAQRCIGDELVALAVRYGVRRYDRGDIVCFLGKRHLPVGVSDVVARRAEGTVVVLAKDGSLVTTFRNANFMKKLKRRERRYGSGGGKVEAVSEEEEECDTCVLEA